MIQRRLDGAAGIDAAHRAGSRRSRVLDGMVGAAGDGAVASSKLFFLAGICFLLVLPLAVFLKVDRAGERGDARPKSIVEM